MNCKELIVYKDSFWYLKVKNLPPEIREKILLYCDFSIILATGNKYYINKVYNKELTWEWAANNNELNTIIWLHFNKKDDFKHGVLYIVKEFKYEKIYDFLKKYDYNNYRKIYIYPSGIFPILFKYTT